MALRCFKRITLLYTLFLLLLHQFHIRQKVEDPYCKTCNMGQGLIGGDPHAGKDWRQKEKEAAEDEKVRQHHRLSGQE